MAINAKKIVDKMMPEEISEMITIGLRDHKSHFERFKEHFFMHDLHKENIERFNPDYDELNIDAGK